MVKNNTSMKYFNATGNEINTKEKIGEILKEMAEILSKSYSPFGSSSIIIDNQSVTKDGYNIMQSLKPESELAKYVTNMVRSLTNQTLLTSGDGKTTAVLLAEALFENLNKVFEDTYQGRTAQDFIIEVNEVASNLIDSLNENKYIPESKDDLLNVAYTSLNNDHSLTQYIKKALSYFEEDEDINIVSTLNSKSSKIEVEVSSGVKVNTPIMFGTGQRYNNNVLRGSKILVLGEKLESNEQLEKIFGIMEYASENDTKIVFVMPEMSAHAQRQIRGKLQAMYMESSPITSFFITVNRGGTQDEREKYEDTIAYLGTMILNITDNFDELVRKNFTKLSVADVKLGTYNTTFIVKKRQNDIEFDERVELLEKIIETGDKTKKKDADYRLKRMTSKVVNIKVGGNIPEDVDRVYDMFQDATLAISYAKDGIVAGMNTAMIKIINKYLSKVTTAIQEKNNNINITPTIQIVKAIKKSYNKLLNLIIKMSRRDVGDDILKEITYIKKDKDILKAYDVKNEEITYTITNPFISERIILLAALEIVKIFITANQIIFTDVYATNSFDNHGR